MSGFLVFVLAIISLAAGAISWFLTPKGANQTYVLASDHPPFLTTHVLLKPDTDKLDAHNHMLLPHVGDHIHGAAASAHG
jgi:hypothetical protein